MKETSNCKNQFLDPGSSPEWYFESTMLMIQLIFYNKTLSILLLVLFISQSVLLSPAGQALCAEGQVEGEKNSYCISLC